MVDNGWNRLMNLRLTTHDAQLTMKTLVFLLLVVGCQLFVSSAHAQVNVTIKNTPINITLVWEASSYVPPFYKGKALMPDGGDARIVAFLPPGVPVTSDISYSWRVDGSIDGDNSGVGRNSYTIESEIFGGSSLVVVEVSNTNGLIGTGALRIPLTKPQILVYADAPLGGVLFNDENPHVAGTELTMETYPLFFTTRRRDNANLSYVWRVNGMPATNPLGNSGRLVLRSEEAIGTTTIGVSVSNADRILESASGDTTIFFE